MHTDARDPHGQDLPHLIEHLGADKGQVFLSTTKIPPEEFVVMEGSGISRKNRLTSSAALSLLKAFSEDQYLLNNERGVFLKTGTLKGVYR